MRAMPTMGPAEVRANSKGTTRPEHSSRRASPTIPARRFFTARPTTGPTAGTRAQTTMTTIDFSKFHGLVPAVVQDAATRDVLMVVS